MDFHTKRMIHHQVKCEIMLHEALKSLKVDRLNGHKLSQHNLTFFWTVKCLVWQSRRYTTEAVNNVKINARYDAQREMISMAA